MLEIHGINSSLRDVEREAAAEFCSRPYYQSNHPGYAEWCVGNQGVLPPSD